MKHYNSIRVMMRAAVLSVLSYVGVKQLPVSEVFNHSDLSTIPDEGFVTMTCSYTPCAGKLEETEGTE